MSVAAQPPTIRRVLIIGSSSVEPSSPLPAAIGRELGLAEGEWVALGVRSSTLAQWANAGAVERALAAVPGGPRSGSDAIVILLTGNDADPRPELVSAIDRAARTVTPIVVWLPPLPYPAGSSAAGRDQRMRDALARAAVARVTSSINLQASHWAADRVHLTRAGHEAYARQVAPALRQALLLRQIGAPQAAASIIGTLVTAGGARLPLTSTDALWLARALVGEGGREADAHAIASTMLRRWALLWDGGQRTFQSLTDLVVGRFRGDAPYDADRGEVELRGYSQPVAVQWRSESGERAERRRRIRSLRWDEIEPYRRQIVLTLITGRARLSAPAAVHFAERSLVEERRRTNPDWQIVEIPGAVNVFVSVEQSRRMRDPQIVGIDQAPPPLPPEAVSFAARPHTPARASGRARAARAAQPALSALSAPALPSFAPAMGASVPSAGIIVGAALVGAVCVAAIALMARSPLASAEGAR